MVCHNAAKGEKRGHWNESKAIQWAQENNRFATNTMAGLTGTIFRNS